MKNLILKNNKYYHFINDKNKIHILKLLSKFLVIKIKIFV